MSDREALTAAMLAHPDEDTPRLALADWLQEHGDPDRAEFIRVQIELARTRAAEIDLPEWFGRVLTIGMASYGHRPHDTPERVALLRREAELYHAHHKEWTAGVPKYALQYLGYVRNFRRGFVSWVTAVLGPFLKAPAALWELHPVESLHLRWVEGQARLKVPACRPLERVRELTLEPSASDVLGGAELLAPYANCPHLADLRVLDLSPMIGVGNGGAGVLGASEFLRPTALALSCGGIDPDAFARLLSSPFASRLRRLEPSELGRWRAALIAEAPLDHLRYLSLEDSGCGDAGVTALTKSRSLRQLVTLNLKLARITDAGLEALAAWPGLAGVRALNLNKHTTITGYGIEALVRSPHFRPEHLELDDTAVGDIGARALADWPGLASLVTLDLSNTQMQRAGGLALADSPYGRKLRHLRLTGNALDLNTIERLRARFGSAIDIESS